MRTAFPYWRSRLAPVFDTARQLRLVESAAAAITGQSDETLPDTQPSLKILQLVELNVDTLVCGAISRPLREMAAAHGIAVIPFIAGELDDIVSSWVAGCLETGACAMPGCRRGRGRHLRGWRAENGRPFTPGDIQEMPAVGPRRRFRGK